MSLTSHQIELLAKIAVSPSEWCEIRSTATRYYLRGCPSTASGARADTIHALRKAGLILTRTDGNDEAEQGRRTHYSNTFAKLTPDGVEEMKARGLQAMYARRVS